MAMVSKNGLDKMTGLPGYDQFLDEFREVLEDDAVQTVSLGLIDIDSFGKYNDEHGRDAGNDLIVYLAQKLESHFAEKAEVKRYGGDAFMVVFKNVDKEDAFLEIEAFRNAFDGERADHGNENGAAHVSISVGVASYPDDGLKEQDILRKVTGALYRAKIRGRNRVALAKEERMVTKTSHYTQGQLEGLSRLAKRQGVGEAELLRESLDDLLRKHNS